MTPDEYNAIREKWIRYGDEESRKRYAEILNLKPPETQPKPKKKGKGK